jgi:hypothetical protein
MTLPSRAPATPSPASTPSTPLRPTSPRSTTSSSTALDNLELDTAFVKPLERTVTPATTNGHIGYLAAAASLAAAAAVATAAACLDAY